MGVVIVRFNYGMGRELLKLLCYILKYTELVQLVIQNQYHVKVIIIITSSTFYGQKARDRLVRLKRYPKTTQSIAVPLPHVQQ